MKNIDMMKKITFLLFLFATTYGFAQAPTVDPPTPPTRNDVDVISIFSDAYNNITGANYNPNWNQSGLGTASSSFEPTGPGGSGNVVLSYPNFNYQGIEFNSVQDITSMEFLHLDIWTVDGVAPNITVISSGAEIPHAIPNGDGKWQSIDIPVAGITGDLTRAIQIKFDGGNGSSTAIYVDNLYFWKTAATSGTDATLSALEVDGVAIAGFTPNSESYLVELPGGTTVVPQITLATTSDPAASANITQATSIPGDASVTVTSQDGSNTKTYRVSYYIGAPHIDAPTPPSRNDEDVISIFSDAYNNITGANYNPNWSQSGIGTANSSFEPTGSGNAVLAYPNFNYQGIEFNNVLDITAMEFLHLDIWTVDGVAPNISLISSGAEIPHAIPNGDGKWQSIDIPVAGITGDLTRAIQIKFDGGNGSSTAIYVDNLYFWKTAATSGTDATLSALEVDGVAIAGFTPNSESYLVELPGGTTVVPQITLATTSDPAASANITQATSIPGDASVTVTSQDGSNTKTYRVSYYIGAPHIDAPTPPSRNDEDVISIFSDAYNNITGANYNPNWSQSGIGTANSSFEPTGSGNAVLAYPNFNYQGIEFNNTLDITSMDFLHLDIWTVDGVAPNISLISSGGEIPHAIPNGDGAWQSVEIPVEGITGDLTNAIQIKFDGGNGSSTAIYVDNLYFYKGEPVGIDGFDYADINVYPNPTNTVWNIKSKQNISSIQVFDIQGKQVITLNPNSETASINASELINGVYFVRLSSAKGVRSVRLIKR